MSWGCLARNARRVPEQSKDDDPGMPSDMAFSRCSRSEGSERTTAYPFPQVMTLADPTADTADSASRLSVPRGTSNAV